MLRQYETCLPGKTAEEMHGMMSQRQRRQKNMAQPPTLGDTWAPSKTFFIYMEELCWGWHSHFTKCKKLGWNTPKEPSSKNKCPPGFCRCSNVKKQKLKYNSRASRGRKFQKEDRSRESFCFWKVWKHVRALAKLIVCAPQAVSWSLFLVAFFSCHSLDKNVSSHSLCFPNLWSLPLLFTVTSLPRAVLWALGSEALISELSDWSRSWAPPLWALLEAMKKQHNSARLLSAATFPAYRFCELLICDVMICDDFKSP